MKKILILDDDRFVRQNIILSLCSYDYELIEASTAEEALKLFKKHNFNIAIVDIILPGISGIEFIKKAKEITNNLKYISITGYSNEKAILELIKIGADRFLKKPYEELELIHAVQQLIKIQDIETQNENLTNKIPSNNEKIIENKKIIGKSKGLLDCLDKADKAAQFNLNTLISGPTGTGKELIANFIYKSGSRAKYKMISVNSAELSSNLFESELFGYKQGAFTGAIDNKVGLFELADKGILFLDEITEIPVDLQAKLLRVIETQKIRKIADSNWKKIDVQILASTNRSIEDAIKKGKLREDLYFRLTPMHIKIPPIKDRIEDIPLLLNYFIDDFNTIHKLKVKKFMKKDVKYLQSLDWPGNIRQIKNFVQNYAIFGKEVSIQQLVNNFISDIKSNQSMN